MELLDIKGVGEKTLSKLEKLEIFSVDDMVNFLPSDFFDMTHYAELDNVTQGEYVLLHGFLSSIGNVFRKSAAFNMFTATLDCDGRKIKLVWFNAPFLRAQLDSESEYNFWGKINIKDKKMELCNPSFEKREGGKRLQGIVPIYSLRGEIGQASFRNFLGGALANFYQQSLLDKWETMTFAQALQKIHFPDCSDDVSFARERMAKEELVYQLLSYKINKKMLSTKKANLYTKDITAIQTEISRLPYELTKSQKTALQEVICGLQNDKPMNRMLLGDVGSGKTVVALLAMIFAVKNAFQACLMAPTEILATQHYKTIKSLFGDDCVVELLTASVSAKKTKDILDRLARGEIDILVGTHSVIGDRVKFRNLSFVVIDELHKFGVRQKSILESKSQDIDTLIMSATPIPRAMALQVFGEIELSTLDAREGTGDNIETFVIGENNLREMYKFLFKKIADGEQAYIVCPLVEDSEGLEIYSAKMLYKELGKTAPNVEIGLIFGKQKDSEKSAIMQNFYDGKIKILIATTVIEVGIDCPNATVICILNADRFGLAGLHQLRGRVGRKSCSKAYCFLHTAKSVENERLLALRDNNDGFAIAEIDAELRGYGDFLGVKQSGSGSNAFINKQFLLECKEKADKIAENPSFESDEKLKKYLKATRQIALL
ncbi:MAG: ATP-dependent DNA helicase RecG [Clostridia bacterium]